jgi:hypothetical protein
MAEKGSRTPASDVTARENVFDIYQEMLGAGRPRLPGMTSRSQQLREELGEKGLRGFKRGGKVKKTGVAKVHKGERVLTKTQAKKPAVKKAVAPKTQHRRSKSPSRPARR